MCKNYIKKMFIDNPEILMIVKDGHYFVKNATDKGYLEAYKGDGIDIGYIKQNKRRGRVQHRVIQTLTCNGNGLGILVDV